ncbi:unnamed protein product [Prorocentrum cordatum]|uniref:Na(+)/H(+) antiporter NhaA n=1 Tax=Prorocentrum cordatum TaxID=2364126 RepID=A0ABN9UYF2_9DINO|nr:unnamed protein product [Polarella glacialis]
MDPEPDLPGACSAQSLTQSPTSRGHRRRGKGVHVRIWEYGGTSWKESRIYSHWLEAEFAEGGDRTDVHLPSVSVQGIMQLQGCLDRPGALLLDPPPDGRTENEFLWSSLCSPLDGGAAVEARRVLGKRRSPSRAEPVDDLRPRSPALDMMQPEAGAECMDISICALEGLQEADGPILLLLRCERPLNSLRYAALVACSSLGAARALHAAREVAKALATAFVDERFVHEVSRAPPDQPSQVVEAFAQFFSTLTIVPTVHIGGVKQGSFQPDSSQQSASCSDVLLSDSLQYQMESRLCKSLGVPHHPRARSEKVRTEESSTGPYWKRCFVEVDCLDSATQEWKMTHQLRQGMEIDAGSGKKAHLPHVSASGLVKIRGFSAPCNVALDVMASSGIAAVDAVVQQLGRTGLPSCAVEEVTSALRGRASQGTSLETTEIEPMSPTSPHPHFFMDPASANQQSELVAPCEEDEAFLILLVPCGEVPASIGITSAFVRFNFPIEFTQCETPVRFLIVLVGPVGSAEEMSQAGNSLAALAVDEDLVGSLDKATDVESFVVAMHQRLDNLPVMPRAHLEGRRDHHHHSESGTKPPGLSQLHGSSSPIKAGARASPPPTESPVLLEGDKSSILVRVSIGHDSQDSVIQDHVVREHELATMSPCRRTWVYAVQKIQKYSMPLVSGVLLALFWANVHERSYHDVIHGYLYDDFSISGHKISLHFIVNDMFMCFFFGLAIKEVTEALLPGGSLSPLRNAANPLCATCGGIIGPIVCYLILALVMNAFGAFDDMKCQVEVSGRRLGGGGGSVQFTGETAPCELSAIINGWGVPTATDISLAWMFALLIFGPGHPAINFLLLLAIVDDAIGMVIIAVFYGDKDKPVLEGKEWLGLVVAAALLAYLLRILRIRQWPVFVLICGPVSWLGLLKAHVHPALALVVVVPFMPATHAVARSSAHRGLGAGVNWSSSHVMNQVLKKARPLTSYLDSTSRGTQMMSNMMRFLQNQDDAPLHLFEHHLKLPVDFGMFFFGLANAGVKLGSVGSVTTCVLVSLIVGKTLGVAGFAILAHCCGFGLPAGITMTDLFTMGALAGVGLTVALFVSNEAFSDPGLQGQAKMGALLSIGSAGFSWLTSVVHRKFCTGRAGSGAGKDTEDSDDDDLEGEDDDDGFEDLVTHELIQKMWEFRRYKARGYEMSIDDMTASVAKNLRKVHRSKTTNDMLHHISNESGDIVRLVSDSSLAQESAGSRPGTALKSGTPRLSSKRTLEKLGPSRDEQRRSSRKRATLATSYLREAVDRP